MSHYQKKLHSITHPVSQKLLNIILKKKTNIALAADVTQFSKLLELADQLGPYICILKTHIDILEDFNLKDLEKLKVLALKHGFLIFEDRKFADIGHTVKNQFQNGIYKIADWADIITVHSVAGKSTLEGLISGMKKECGILLLAQMSSENNLISSDYTAKTINLAEQFQEHVMGFISQQKLSENPRWLYLTPGIQINQNKDNLGQNYITPQKALIENQVDVLIVGRGILNAADHVKAIKEYISITELTLASQKVLKESMKINAEFSKIEHDTKD